MTTRIELFKLRPDNDVTISLKNSDFEDVQNIIGNFKKNLKEFYVQYYEYENDFGDKSIDDILTKCINLFKNDRPSDLKKPLEYSDIIIINEDQLYKDPYGWRLTDEAA